MFQSSLMHAVVGRMPHDYKDSVRVATNAALPACTAAGAGFGKTLTADANGVLGAIDGSAVVPALNDRVLVKDQVAGADRGLYVVTAVGVADPGGSPWVLTRAEDFDDATDVTASVEIPIEEGTYADQVWTLTTNNPIVVDTTALTFAMGPAGFVPLTRTLTAGAGLTGGGDLSADRTFDAVANADGSIVVNADDIQLGRIAGATAPVAGATNAIYGITRLTSAPAVADTPIAVGSNLVLTAGAGLTGGGDLTVDRTFDVIANADGSIVVNADDVQLGRVAGATAPASGATDAIYGITRLTPAPAVADTPIAVGSNRGLTAGAGLTGGGDLSADRTFDVGAGTGITVNADDVAVSLGYAFPWTADHSWTSTTDVAATSRALKLSHRRATPTAGDSLGLLEFWGNDNNVGLNETRYAYIEGVAVDVSDTSEDGALDYYVMSAGSLVRMMRCSANVCEMQSVETGNTGVELRLYQDSASPAANDIPGSITFYGENNASAKVQYAGIRTRIDSVAAGAHDGTLLVNVANAAGGVVDVLDVRRGQLMIVPGGNATAPSLARQGDGTTGVYWTGFGLAIAASGERCAVFGETADVAELYSNSATAVGFDLQLYQDSASPLGDTAPGDGLGDDVGILSFYGEDDGSAKTLYAQMMGHIVSPANVGGEDGELDLYATVAGVSTLGFAVGSTGAAIGVGFFGVAPVARAAALTQTYATADRTLANNTAVDIGAFTGGVVGFLDAAERDNVRTQFNALRVDVDDLKQFVNSLVDDLQLYGLEQ